MYEWNFSVLFGSLDINVVYTCSGYMSKEHRRICEQSDGTRPDNFARRCILVRLLEQH